MQKPDTGKLIVYINGDPVECTPKGPFIPDPDLDVMATEYAGTFTLTISPMPVWDYENIENHLSK